MTLGEAVRCCLCNTHCRSWTFVTGNILKKLKYSLQWTLSRVYPRETLARSREQGWRSGENARLPPTCPGLFPGPGVTCGLSLLLVLVLVVRGFLRVLRFSSLHTKTDTPNSNSTWKRWTKSHLVNVPLLNSNLFHLFVIYYYQKRFVFSKEDVNRRTLWRSRQGADRKRYPEGQGC